MNLVQILILLFIFFVLYRLVIKLIKHEITIFLFAVWLIFWLNISFFAIYPNVLSYISSKLGVGRGVDVAIYASILVIFYSIFRIFTHLQMQEKKISEIVRKIAIILAEKPKKK